MITKQEAKVIQEQIDREQMVRVVYTRRDGSQVRGTVRSMYLDKNMLSMKPDVPLKQGGKTYPQSFRFRRLTLFGQHQDIFKQHLMSAAALARKQDEKHRVIFTCRDGLFVLGGSRYLLERTSGMPDGYIDGDIGGINVYEVTLDDIKKYMDDHRVTSEVVTEEERPEIHDHYEYRPAPVQAMFKVNSGVFNKFLAGIDYTSQDTTSEHYRSYFTHSTDIARVTVDMSNSTVCVEIINVAGKKYWEHVGTEAEGILKIQSSGSAEMLLSDLKWLLKTVRQRDVVITFDKDHVTLETNEQVKRIKTAEVTEESK